MGKASDLIAKATKDIELATRYKRIREYVTANLLYNKAVEKVLKALFITKTKKDPPKNATAEYLARRTGVPEEISMYINSMQENEEPVNEFIDFGNEMEVAPDSSEQQALFMDGLSKRLLDYVSSAIKV